MPPRRADLPAVVLNTSDYGEADKILTFFCRDFGRLTAIAKGAHRSRKRFVNKLELFSFLHISFSKSSTAGLGVLHEAELLDSFISIRSMLPRYRVASIIREIVLMATDESAPDDGLFQLTLWALHRLDTGDDQKTVLALFLIKLFDCVGYRPNVTLCQSCGRKLSADDGATFSIQNGGAVCGACLPSPGNRGWQLSPGAARTVAAVQQQPVARLDRFRPGGAIMHQILACFHAYTTHTFQREVHSWRWLDEV